jgi:hypothetical protein
MSKNNEASKPVKIRPYDAIGLIVGGFAMLVGGGLYALLATHFLSEVPLYVIIPVGLILSVGALIGTMEYFFHLDSEQHKRTGYRHVHAPYGL